MDILEIVLAIVAAGSLGSSVALLSAIKGRIPLAKLIAVYRTARKIVAGLESGPLSNRDRRELAVKQLTNVYPGVSEGDAFRIIHIALKGNR